MAGLLKFARYAFPPNVLRFCGPAQTESIFEELKENKNGGSELRHLLSRFAGAVPYLQLIAGRNGIKDIFDERVVEAYWLGNNFLQNVEAKDIYSHTKDRFKKNMAKKDWNWLISGSVPKAKPFHAFHVFDIYRRTGLLHSGKKENILETMDKCRIAWGKVESINLTAGGWKQPSLGWAMVSYNPLEFKDKKIILGKKTLRKSFVVDSSIAAGDEVSLHWDYVCDKISPSQKKNLLYWTNSHLELANKTV